MWVITSYERLDRKTIVMYYNNYGYIINGYIRNQYNNTDL